MIEPSALARDRNAIKADLAVAFDERQSVAARGHARRRLAADVPDLLAAHERVETTLKYLAHEAGVHEMDDGGSDGWIRELIDRIGAALTGPTVLKAQPE